MAVNIIDEMQKILGIGGLQKIDPNTQEVKRPENITSENYIWQAAIPTVLLGLYKFSGDETGNAAIINGTFPSDILGNIFNGKKELVIERVANYTGNTIEYTVQKMEIAAKTAVQVIQKNTAENVSDSSVKTFLINQRNNILAYLPAELQLGKIFGDNTIDDRTNKMEGPMSNHMHWLEKFFPSTDRKKEENW
jgi:hypothetical protein